MDPRFNVALEASAGTGKTQVLVDRYVNLLDHGVDPANVLAMTFTRKAAAEMRARIVAMLRARAERGEISPARWRHLRDRLGDVAISTIDAFCLSLLREFPLEADLDPGFSMADETEVPRLIDESLDRALQICRNLVRDDEDVALVFAHLGERRVRQGLATLLSRRIVAPRVLAKYLETAPPGLDAPAVTRRAARGLVELFAALPGGLDAFLETGPPVPSFLLLTRDLQRLRHGTDGDGNPDPAAVQAALARAADHLLTQAGKPRKALGQPRTVFVSESEWRSHRELVLTAGPALAALLATHRRDLNMLAARGLRRMFAVATTEYRRTLDAHTALDFSDVLLRALALLRQMEEFAQSRYRLESRYQHVLVDEFQDTSRAQWELVALLVRSWGEGAGLSASGPLLPSIFIVGDRKQSIYGFREADVSILREAGSYLGTLRPGGDVRRAISRSFRSVPPLLAFVNDVCADMDKAPERRDRFEYEEQDRFPVDEVGDPPGAAGGEPLGLVVADEPEACAEAVAEEVARLVASGVTVRDRDGGAPRAIRPGDVAILFRTREAAPRVRAGVRATRAARVRLQGPGFLRRRRGQGRAGGAALPRRAILGPTGGGAPPVAAGAAVGRRPPAACTARGAGAAPVGAGGRARRDGRAHAGPDSGGGGAVARVGGPRSARGPARSRAGRVGLRARAAGAALSPGAREPEEDPRPGAPRREPRVRDARAHCRAPGPPVGRRGAERSDRRARRRQPDDGPRGQGPRVSRRLRGQSHSRAPAGGGHPCACPPKATRRGSRSGRSSRRPTRTRPAASARRPSGSSTWPSRARATGCIWLPCAATAR